MTFENESYQIEKLSNFKVYVMLKSIPAGEVSAVIVIEK